MKTRHYCETCWSWYETPEQAHACEQQPKPWLPPVGMLLGNASDKSSHHSADMTFAVAQVPTQDRGSHAYSFGLWAARDNGAGDSLPGCGYTCGNHMVSSRTPFRAGVPDLSHPTAKRLVKALQKACIPVTVWTGKGSVPLADYQRQLRSRMAVQA